MADWSQRSWGDVITLQRGFDITKSVQNPRGLIPVVSSGGISSFHDRAMSAGPGVVMGRKGTLGRVYFINGPYWPHDTTLWVKDFKGNHPQFVYYALQNLDVSQLNVGTASPTLNRNHVHPIPVLWTDDVSEQRAVAATLGALDDKIESNGRLTALLSALIGAHIASSSDKESRQIPVSELGRFVNGGAFTKGASGSARMVVRIAELNRGPGASTVYSDMEVADDKTARPGDILMSWSGSLGVYRWFRDEAIINQHIFKVISTRYPAWLVFDRLSAAMEAFRGIAKDKATTMGHIQRKHLESTFVDLPTDSEVQALDAVLGPMWDRLLHAERESIKLAALREALLPELLSGRVRVAEGDA